MEALQNIWAAVRPHLGWILLVLGILLVVVLALTAKKWRPLVQKWLKNLKGGAGGDDEALKGRRLLRVYQRFLRAQTLRYRSAVADFPTVVVLGQAGSGKTQLIGLEVDWERQQRQFMPSDAKDSLLKLYLGPDSVVQELSSSLLLNIEPEAEEALRKLWQVSIGRRKTALVVVVVSVEWLRDTRPDTVRDLTHVLRGKINLISEVRKAPVETRICLTHMDMLPGFKEFAQLLREHGVPLDLDVPPAGQEAQLANHLKLLEEHLALGLTSLPVESFARLEEFYSGLRKAFDALIQFTTGLREGASLTYAPNLSRVYLSTLSPDSRATGALAVRPEREAKELQAHHRWVHVRRCALILAVGCLPVCIAYANFYRLLHNAAERVAQFEATTTRLTQQGLSSRGSVVDTEANEAMEAMGQVWNSTRYWPPLKDSYKDNQLELRARLSHLIRISYIQPLFEHCQEVCGTCGNQIPGCSKQAQCASKPPGVSELYHYEEQCRPEQMLYMQAILNASREDVLGQFILQSLDSTKHSKWRWARDALDLTNYEQGESQKVNWVDKLGLIEEVAGIYVINSDAHWELTEDDLKTWARWPYQGLTFEAQIAPWWQHFERLHVWLQADGLQGGQWEELRQERQELQKLLESAEHYTAGAMLLDRLNAAPSRVNQKKLEGIESTLRAINWMREQSQVLQAILDLEVDADKALQSGLEMSAAQLLTQDDGLFVPKTEELLVVKAPGQDAFELSPEGVSERLLDKLVLRVKQSEQLAFDQVKGPSSGNVVPASGVAGEDGVVEDGVGVASGPVISRGVFDTDIKPLVDEFTERLAKSKLTPEVAAEKEAFLLGKLTEFARLYRGSLFTLYRDYKFEANVSTLRSELGALSQPSSKMVDMLRDVSDRASIGPLDNPLYEPLRDAIAPFKPIIQLMTPDKDGKLAALDQYRLLVAQMHGELSGAKTAAKVPADKAGGGKEEEAPAEGETPGAQLMDLLSPLGKAALPMLLEEDGSYLAQVDAWLDQQGILGELRRPFREPFLAVRNIGREEVEKVLREQWTAEYKRTLEPLVKRYPFDPNAQQEIDPADLEVVRRKDGEFWQFIDRVMAPVLVERGSDWSLRRPLRNNRLSLPSRMLSTLEQMSRLSRTLWDDQGKPVPLALQVRPLPLPRVPVPGDFVTMSYFKCGGASAFGFNQSPTWQDFPLSWWDQRTASLGVEMRSPLREGKRYRTVEMARSSWSCFRLLELGTLTEEQNMVWALPGPDGDARAQLLEVSFGLRGKPWAAFRKGAK